MLLRSPPRAASPRPHSLGLRPSRSPSPSLYSSDHDLSRFEILTKNAERANALLEAHIQHARVTAAAAASSPMHIKQAQLNRPPSPSRRAAGGSMHSTSSTSSINIIRPAIVPGMPFLQQSPAATLTGRGAMVTAPSHRVAPTATAAKVRIGMRPGRLVRPTAGWSQDCIMQPTRHASPMPRTLEGSEIRVSTRPMPIPSWQARRVMMESRRPHTAPAGRPLSAARRPPPRPATSAPCSPDRTQRAAAMVLEVEPPLLPPPPASSPRGAAGSPRGNLSHVEPRPEQQGHANCGVSHGPIDAALHVHLPY